MTYPETISYLFNVAPLFQNIGGGAYKEGLSNTHALDEHLGHPHRAYKTIHVAGTNGKGSVSHTLAAILQSAGLRVGLYTSPHLVDFRERIRVNGEMIPEQRVIDFVEHERAFFEPLHPSFFELTTALAFLYFREQKVDVAVIEVGLGGRLDCTNIITPLLSVVTNISFDHTQFLGTTLEAIARDKAGIIKPGVPVVIGETGGHEEVRRVFLERARSVGAPIAFADEETHPEIEDLEVELKGLCQEKNTATILTALKHLPIAISDKARDEGFAHVCEITGLMGRWQTLQERPTVVCDTGHNPGGLQYIAEQLKEIENSKFKVQNYASGEKENETQGRSHNSQFSILRSALPLGSSKNSQLRIVLGMVSDKDVRGSLRLFPQGATYYFTQASVKRAMPAEEIARLGQELGLQSHCTTPDGQPVAYPTVREAYEAALGDASPDDFIFVGGSSFIVADLLKSLA